MKDSLCIECKKRKKKNTHLNTKYCDPCRLALLKKPKTSMTPLQVKKATNLIGTMPRNDIAKTLGVSISSLKRAFHGTRMAYFNRYSRDPGLVKKVCTYYEKHGRRKTEEKFPDLKIRSIVEKYKLFEPRQSRWTESQIKQAVQFAGLVSFNKQAKHFNRPLAHGGSINSLWMKRFGTGQRGIHGMADWKAKLFVKDSCPRIVPDFSNADRGDGAISKICLWTDMEKHFREDCPQFIKDAVMAMAKFQRWIYNSKRPQIKIKKIISEFAD